MLIIKDGGLFDVRLNDFGLLFNHAPSVMQFVARIELDEDAPHSTTQDDMVDALEYALHELEKRLDKAESLINDINQDMDTVCEFLEILENNNTKKKKETGDK